MRKTDRINRKKEGIFGESRRENIGVGHLEVETKSEMHLNGVECF